jgi:hypothetical protein
VIDLADERFTKNLWSERGSSDLPALANVADDSGLAAVPAHVVYFVMLAEQMAWFGRTIVGVSKRDHIIR